MSIDERNMPAEGPSPELQQRMGELFLRTHEDYWTITAEVREIQEM